jgi:hypothetical protein
VELAYIVSAYKLHDQLARLVARLSTERTRFFIHVDRKTDEVTYRKMTRSLEPLANVRFLERHRCDYGGFGHVRATLKGIDAVVREGWPFDYAILLTGQDYPIKSNEQIDDFFARNHGRSYMTHFPLPTREWEGGGLDRISAWHVRIRDRHFRVGGGARAGIARTLPGGLRPFGGSGYWCLSDECARYVHEFVGRHPAYTRFFRFVDVPDEIFFQTIVLNSAFRDKVVNDDLRYVEWRDPAVAGGPAVLGERDYPKLARSDKLFARKFDVSQDAVILDLLDQKLAATV